MDYVLKTLTIIDGYGFIFRAYYALPKLSTTFGLHVGGVYGFINILLKYLSNPGYLVVVFDTGEKTFRHKIYPKYKANRRSPPEDLIPQFAILREAVAAFNLNCEEVTGYEADDVIATLAKIYSKYDDLKITVVTVDKDLFQLIDEKVSIFDPMKNKYIKEEDVTAKFGVGIDKILDFLSLTGDTSDNIPGVLGIGIKTAAKLLTEFNSLENILNNVYQIKENKCREAILAHKESALLSKKLVSLATTVKIKGDLEKYRIKPINHQKLIDFFKKYEFKSLILRVQKLFLSERKHKIKIQEGYNYITNHLV